MLVGTDVSLPLTKNVELSNEVASVYDTLNFDFKTGADGIDGDFGQIEFVAASGFPDQSLNGYFLYGRKWNLKEVDLGFIDKGQVELSSVTSAPKYGWSAPSPSMRNKIKIVAGNVYLFRAHYPSGDLTYYGKILIKDISPQRILFDYGWQKIIDDTDLF